VDKKNDLPVMLIHGFAEDATIWDAIAPRLTNTCRLLIPDLPGSGRVPLQKEETSIDTLAAYCIEALDREKIDRCIFIGHSMGGYVTLSIAEHYPERVLAFGFFHSTAYADTEEKRTNRSKSIEFIGQHGSGPYLRQSVPNLFATATREQRPELIEDMIRNYSGFRAESLSAYLGAMARRPDRTFVLRDSNCPVLFIIGQNDIIIPMAQSLEQSHMPRLSHIHILPAAGHMGMLEEPGAGAAAIQSFINFIQQS
jgi:pimeloyl-ACP methyl ester carboxylesterase